MAAVLCYSTCLMANTAVSQETDTDLFIKKLRAYLMKNAVKPEISGGGFYNSFKFNSTNGNLYNRYNGHSSFGSLGANNFEWRDFIAGLSISNIETAIDAETQLAPTVNQNNNTKIGNAALNVYVSRLLFNAVYTSVFAGYGHSEFGVNSTITDPTTTTAASYGSAYFSGNNNYIGARTMYMYPYRKFLLQGGLGYVYSSFFQPAYDIVYNNRPSSNVAALTTRIGILTENIRIDYRNIDHVVPYLDLGLLQVVNRSYSNTSINASTSSALPQLTLANNGFFVGAGLAYTQKHFRVTPYYQFVQRTSSFTSNLGGVRVDFICG